MPAFVDTHAHLQEPEFDADLDAVVERAHGAGLTAIVVPGVDATTSQKAAWLADRFPGVYFAAGFHPHEASHFEPGARAGLRTLLRHPKAVAVGEIGLDYYRLHSPHQAQLDTFSAMLDLAAESQLPVIVHRRDAAEDTLRILRSWSTRQKSAYEGRPLGVMHYFSGPPEEAARYVELGFLISVHTSVTHAKAYELRQVIADVGIESLVIETDSPYGAPQSARGKRNEPALVTEAAAKIAEVKGVTVEEVARTTTANAARLFRLPSPHGSSLIGASV